ncbi:MAG: hypothetical protein WC549_01960 [Actinomycetota bacterium]
MLSKEQLENASKCESYLFVGLKPNDETHDTIYCFVDAGGARLASMLYQFLREYPDIALSFQASMLKLFYDQVEEHNDV